MMSACFSNVGLRGEREREVIQLKSFKELDVIFIGPALSGLGNGVRLPHLLNFHQYLELSCSPPSITTIGRPNSWVVAIESLLVVTAEIESVGDDKYKGRMRRDATGIQGPDISNVEESEEGLESREGKEPIEGHASSSPETAVATGIQGPDISNVEEPEEGLESGKASRKMSDSRGIGTCREGKEPIEGHASSSPETAVATGIQRPDISNMEELEEGLESGIYRKASRKMSDRRGIGTCREGKEPIEGHASSSPETAVATGIQGPDISNVEEPEEGLESGCDGQLRVEPYIPEVLLVEIFSRLPEGAQLRLQAVCKSWCRLIPTVQPRGGTVYHLPTGDLLNDLASFMMPGETVKAAILRLGREKRGPMSFAILKENMKALRQTNLFKQRVDRLVSRGFKDIEEWTKEDVLEASKKWSSTCKSV